MGVRSSPAVRVRSNKKISKYNKTNLYTHVHHV